jgi:hypothetical protein
MKSPFSHQRIAGNKKPFSIHIFWEAIFFALLAILALEFFASSFFFLRAMRILNADSGSVADAQLERVQLLHQKVEGLQETVSARMEQ